MVLTLETIAGHIGATLFGDGALQITGVGTLEGAGPTEISFLTNPRYRHYLATSRAGAVILSARDRKDFGGNALVADNPHAAYARASQLFAAPTEGSRGIDPAAVIDPSAELEENVTVAAGVFIGARTRIGRGSSIGPGCLIGADCTIGRGSRLVGQVAVYRDSHIGDRCIVHAGAVIGSDGFGFAHDAGRWIKLEQLGRARIGDDVEIGAGTTIDRGAVDDTVIGDGVKLDNLVHIGHNVRIGAHTIIAAQVGIAGSTRIGEHCAIGGQVGIHGHLTIADGVTLTARSMVTGSISAPGVYSGGTPTEPTRQWRKTFSRIKQLDDMARRIRHLENELKTMKKG